MPPPLDIAAIRGQYRAMIGLERSLSKWQAAGLVDRATADAIRYHEAKTARPFAQWAVASLGLLALALGLALVVAANWDQISGPVKLAVHYALTAAAAVAVWHGQQQHRRWQSEGALFLLGALVLAGIALQGQVYQLTSPIWQPLSFWALLCGPALLLLGATRLTGTAWALMLGWLGMVLAFEDHAAFAPYFTGIALALPFLLLIMALFARGGVHFTVALRDMALLYLLGIASIAHFAWATTISTNEAHEALRSVPLPLIAAAASLLLSRRLLAQPRVEISIIVASFAATALALLLPHGEDWQWRLLGAFIYTAMWGSVCRTALLSGWRFLFGLSIAAIALRLFIVYFELFGSLATTGIGLIIGGLLVLALLAGWRRVMALLPRAKGARP